MTAVWIVVLGSGIATVLLKAAGPVLLGGRALPARLNGVVTLLGPALLAALVATNTFGAGRSLTLDARVIGVAAAAVAVAFRAPVLIVVLLAASTTALARAIA